jgi:hypothetical protein
MTYAQAFNKEYLLQQGMADTPENVVEYGVDEADLKLLYETERYWIVLNEEDNGLGGQWLNVVWKEGVLAATGERFTRRMETTEL